VSGVASDDTIHLINPLSVGHRTSAWLWTLGIEPGTFRLGVKHQRILGHLQLQLSTQLPINNINKEKYFGKEIYTFYFIQGSN
jgi:hypothetical protein